MGGDPRIEIVEEVRVRRPDGERLRPPGQRGGKGTGDLLRGFRRKHAGSGRQPSQISYKLKAGEAGWVLRPEKPVLAREMGMPVLDDVVTSVAIRGEVFALVQKAW
jgi:hypothetical protein